MTLEPAMRRTTLACAALLIAAAPAMAGEMKFWNQTQHELTSVKLAPAGTTQWGAEQTDNDPDHGVDADERLRIVGVRPGRYDVRIAQKSGRVCIVRDVEVKAAGKVAFSIDEAQLTDCAK